MYFWHFFRNADIHIIPGKLSNNHLHAWLFSNPYGKILFLLKIIGQICLLALILLRTCPHGLENQYARKWISENLPAFLGNCQKSICMHGCSFIHVERIKSLLEFHGVRIWEFNIYKLDVRLSPNNNTQCGVYKITNFLDKYEDKLIF